MSREASNEILYFMAMMSCNVYVRQIKVAVQALENSTLEEIFAEIKRMANEEDRNIYGSDSTDANVELCFHAREFKKSNEREAYLTYLHSDKATEACDRLVDIKDVPRGSCYQLRKKKGECVCQCKDHK